MDILRILIFLAYIGEEIFQSGRVAGQLVDIVTPEIVIFLSLPLQEIFRMFITS